MQIRFRILEHLMRSMLESQAAMMAAMTQMQQALLSRMIPNHWRPEQRLAIRLRCRRHRPTGYDINQRRGCSEEAASIAAAPIAANQAQAVVV